MTNDQMDRSTASPDIEIESARVAALIAKMTTAGCLRVGVVGGDKPGILAGDVALCRLREVDQGAALGEFVTAAADLLPRLIDRQHIEAPVATQAVAPAQTDGLREPVELAISTALSLQRGFPRMTIKLWSRVIFSAIQPFLSGASESTAKQASPPSPFRADESTTDTESRLQAVTQFCSFLLAQDESETMPNAYALEQVVNEWNKAHNANAKPVASVAGSGEGEGANGLDAV